MTLTETIRNILENNTGAMTPQEIREVIKRDHPEFYGTLSHMNNVEKGHYKDLDHALVAQIYSLVKINDSFYCDRSFKPLKVSLAASETESLPVMEDYESEDGIVYILKTDTYTKSGKEIIKIGFTTQEINKRIDQLYTTGVPYKFTVHTIYRTRNYIELEIAMHKLLDRFKLNKSREFFVEDVLPYISEIIALHEKIQSIH